MIYIFHELMDPLKGHVLENTPGVKQLKTRAVNLITCTARNQYAVGLCIGLQCLIKFSNRGHTLTNWIMASHFFLGTDPDRSSTKTRSTSVVVL